ncbi:MAG: hypothetical protein VB108_10690 [Anaerolineaceae bacterium]|nr:hypothetical protein [Anaerolineaceae bacterium]
MPNISKRINRVLGVLLALTILNIFLGTSVVFFGSETERIRKFSRAYEFNYLEWELNAFLQKSIQAATKAEKLLSHSQQAHLVNDSILTVREQNQLEFDLKNALASPDKAEARKANQIKVLLDQKNAELKVLSALAEAVIQNQTERILVGQRFGVGGQIMPPVLYQISEMPLNLIVSPRTEIKSIFETNLEPGIDALEKNRIEEGIRQDYDLSALVEPIGGLGAYPTMVMQTTDLAWLLDTVAHEWTHNWLSFHSLGLRYFDSGEMRTVNETTASISGREISLELLKVWYPNLLPSSANADQPKTKKMPFVQHEEPFNFRKEMHATRVKVDALLAEGKVDEAETYMEERRLFFWQKGYLLRKINQAYFAFYGSYNDIPGGGASGNDPVGPAVQQYRKQFSAFHDFLVSISSVKSFDDLKARLQ